MRARARRGSVASVRGSTRGNGPNCSIGGGPRNLEPATLALLAIDLRVSVSRAASSSRSRSERYGVCRSKVMQADLPLPKSPSQELPSQPCVAFDRDGCQRLVANAGAVRSRWQRGQPPLGERRSIADGAIENQAAVGLPAESFAVRACNVASIRIAISPVRGGSSINPAAPSVKR